MKTHRVKLLTIIAPDVLEARLAADVLRLGAKGYTVASAVGAGLSGKRDSDWEGRNIRLETLVNAQTAERILAELSEHYFESYGVIAFLSDVEVLRANKYE